MRRLTTKSCLEYLNQCRISSDDLRLKSSASETLVLPEHTTEQEVILSREMRIFKNAPECLVWMREPNITSLDVGILQLITQSSSSLLEEPGLLFSSGEFAGESTRCDYKTVWSRPIWPNRDPLEEEGELIFIGSSETILSLKLTRTV